MPREQAQSVGWHLMPDGYGVYTHYANDMDVYEAGNHPDDSQGHLPLGHPDAESIETLQKFAEQTAREIAAEKGLPQSAVYHDTDEEAEWREEAIQTAFSWSADHGNGLALYQLASTRKLHDEAHRRLCLGEVDQDIEWNKAWTGDPDEANDPAKDIPALLGLRALVEIMPVGQRW